MIAQHQLDAALERLDPSDRALLELAARRGLDDREIAGFLGLEPAEVAHRRELALVRLADQLGLPGSDHRALQEQIGGADGPQSAGAGEGGDSFGGGGKLAAGLFVLAVIAVAVALALSAGSDSGETRRAEGGGEATSTASKPAPRPRAGPLLTMQRLNSTNGSGTARIVLRGGSGRLSIRAAGFLPPRGGGYAVWLFNSPADARRLYATSDTTITQELPLPRDYARFRFAEVARAIPALDSPHSGLTLLRAPTAELAPR